MSDETRAHTERPQATPTGTNGDVGGDESAAQAWLERLAEGRFTEAHQAYLLATAGSGQDADLAHNLAILADLQGLVRDKAFARATSRLEAFEQVDRLAIVDWSSVETELAELREIALALERKRLDDVGERLAGLTPRFFLAEADVLAGTLAILHNESAGAREHFERALAHDPSHYRALTNLGNVALEEGQVDEAIDLYERALKLNDNFANAHHNLGVAYRRKGQVARSVRSLRRAQQALQRHQTEEARASARTFTRARAPRLVRWVVTGTLLVIVLLVLRRMGLI